MVAPKHEALRTHCINNLLGDLTMPADIKTEVHDFFESHKKFRELFGFRSESKPRQWLGKFTNSVQNTIFFIAERLQGSRGHNIMGTEQHHM